MTIPTNDQIVAELNAANGTTDQNYEAFCNRLNEETNHNGVRFLQGIVGPAGVTITNGVVAEVRAILQSVADSLTSDEVEEIRQRVPDGSSIGGLRKGPVTERNGKPVFGHAFGTCLDFAQAPYLFGEAGEAALDDLLRPIYHRIAQMFLGRDSIIPTLGQNGLNVADSYDRLAEESVSHKAYFYFVKKPVSELVDYLRNANGVDALSAGVQGITLKAQILSDYITVTKSPGEIFNDATGQLERPAPVPAPSGMDRPYTATDAKDGFLEKLPRGMTIALSMEGMNWGGSELGPASGDLMHFQLDGNHPLMVSLVGAYATAKSKIG